MNSSRRIGHHHYRATKRRTKKADQGHSIVLMESWSTDEFGIYVRRAITCQCGKRYTGNGDRSWYSYDAHRSQSIEK